MKKLFIFLLTAFSIAAFGQTTDATLTTQAQEIKNETTAGANTATRVGTHLQNLVYSKKSFFTDGTASGTDTYSVTLDNGAVTSLTTQWFIIKFTNANSGASTLNINAIGAKSLVKTDGTALASGDIDAGSVHLLSYDGTNLQVLSIGGSGGGGTTAAGAVGNVQYKSNGGGLQAEAALTYDSALNILTVGGLINPVSALTDGAAITITGTKHTLTTVEGGITFTISYTGDEIKMKAILNTTSATWTFPAGALCTVEGVAQGTNTAPVTAVSGDTFIINIENWGSGVYSVFVKNIGQ